MKWIVAAALSTLVSSSDAASLRQSLRQEALQKVSGNHPSCYDILDTWWETRESEKSRGDITSLDATCAAFDGQPEQCKSKESRVSSSMSTEMRKAACTMVGAHSSRCMGNPCNHLNTGDCTIQATAGVCRWFTNEEKDINNRHWENMAQDAERNGDTDLADEYRERLLPSKGCFRNPCNRAGFGTRPRNECERGEYNVPGLIECTWCKGAGDPRLKGKGMGCQDVQVTTTAECALVNNNSVEQSSVYMNVNNNKCQCSNEFSACESVVSSRSGNFVKRYK